MVNNEPTEPIYMTSTIHLGSLYLFLLNPSIWKGIQIAAAKAAMILEIVVNILNVPRPASGVLSLKKLMILSTKAIMVNITTIEHIIKPTMQRILLIVLALVIATFLCSFIIYSLTYF